MFSLFVLVFAHGFHGSESFVVLTYLAGELGSFTLSTVADEIFETVTNQDAIDRLRDIDRKLQWIETQVTIIEFILLIDVAYFTVFCLVIDSAKCTINNRVN